MPTPSELVEQALQETSGPPPRRIRLRSMGGNGSFWIKNAFIFLVFLFIVSIFTYTVVLPLLAAQYGQPAQAQITGMRVHRGRGTSYEVRVAYQDGTGMRTASIGTVSYSAYYGLKIGQEVGIHYFDFCPGAPSLDLSPPSFWSLLPVLVFAVVLTVLGPVSILRQKGLLTRGRGVKGRVDWAGGKRLKAQFEHERKAYLSSGPAYCYGQRLNIGDTVVVLYDPDHPDQNMVYDPSNCFWVPAKDAF